MATKVYRRDNLKFLVAVYGSQSALASKIAPETPTQPMMSQILGNSSTRRLFHDHEVSTIERKIGIPDGWMDKYQLQPVWPLVKQFGRLPEDTRKIINEIIKFVEKSAE